MIMQGLLVALLGASFGSFAGVIIYRWPLGLSLVPGSFCASCKKNIRPWHNIPIISWLKLGGRCAYCQAPFGLRPLVLEVIFLMCAIALYMKVGLSLTLIDKFGFVFLLICLAYIDLDTFFLPLSLIISLFLWSALFCVIYYYAPQLFIAPAKPIALLEPMIIKKIQGFSLSDRLFGAIFGLLGFSLVNVVASAIFRRSGRISKGAWAMGWGDPLLLMAIGLAVGLSHLVLVIFIASFLGSVVGIVMRLWKKDSQVAEGIAPFAIPYGPFLAIAGIYVYLL